MTKKASEDPGRAEPGCVRSRTLAVLEDAVICLQRCVQQTSRRRRLVLHRSEKSRGDSEWHRLILLWGLDRNSVAVRFSFHFLLCWRQVFYILYAKERNWCDPSRCWTLVADIITVSISTIRSAALKSHRVITVDTTCLVALDWSVCLSETVPI